MVSLINDFSRGMPFVRAAVLATAMLLLPESYRGACYWRLADAFFTANGRTRQRLPQCNSRSWVAIVATTAAGAHWCTGCTHVRYDAWPIGAGCGRTGRRTSRVWRPAGDRGQNIPGLRYTITIISHDLRPSSAAMRRGELFVPDRVAASCQELAGDGVIEFSESLHPKRTNNQCKLVQLLQVLFSKG